MKNKNKQTFKIVEIENGYIIFVGDPHNYVTGMMPPSWIAYDIHAVHEILLELTKDTDATG